MQWILKKSSIWGVFLGVTLLVGIMPMMCRRGGLFGHRGRRAGPARPVDRATAERLYRTYCADCHGVNGDGQGRFADRFRTRPTDFRAGVYKFKRTPTGQPPADADIFRTLTIGVRGTGMVPQLHLSEAERWGLVRYLKRLSPVFAETQQPVQPLSLPPRPNLSTRELLRIGREWYTKAGCVQCHGPEGRGDGPAVPNLKDRRGFPVVMPDLTLVPYKQGENVEAIAWTILTGRDGTPMPSYANALTPEQLWGIATYVRSLQRGRKPAGMMGLIGEEILAMRIDMEAVHAWRMGGMPMMRMRRSPRE